MEQPEVCTPEELAKQMGWSARRVRELARTLGACRILGNRMRLTKEDVDAILEATKPKPLGRPPTVRDIFRAARTQDEIYDLVRLAAKQKLPRRPRGKLPRRPTPTT